MTAKTERPSDLTERETWQWAEADFCDRMAESSKENIPAWLKRGGENFVNPAKYEGALRAAVRAEAFEQMATHLRMPYYSRKEAEVYRERFGV